MKKLIKNTDFVLFISVIILVILGVIGIYTAGFNTDDGKTEWIKQLVWVAVSMCILVVIWRIDYAFSANVSLVLYPVFLVLLILVLFTPEIKGASSWFDLGFFKFQPSELMKIIYILAFAKFLDYITKREKEGINKWYNIIFAILILAIPIVLICMQPDFGTAIVFVVITIFMMFKANLKYRYILAVILLLLILIPITYFFILNPTQQERILVFLNPERDPLGTGYNAIQSKTAIGSGKVFGTGYLNGIQTQFGYLPIKSSDFIFAVLSEELGFFISVIIVLMYVVILIRMLIIAKNSKDKLGSYIVIGVFAMIFFHFLENIGMTLGLLPITGIPLPFVSYGGSSMLTNFIALALVLSVSARKSTGFFEE